jgi:hypothetical protein
MNGRNILTALLVTLSISCAGTRTLSEDESAKASQINRQIESKNFTFKAQSATPLGGRYIQLTSEYDVRVKNDSLVTYLPYFGRAFVAPMNPSEGGIMLNSTSFQYNVENRKNGGWNIMITPEDTRDVRMLQFTVTETGNATLQVMSNNKQPITFNGYIQMNAG